LNRSCRNNKIESESVEFTKIQIKAPNDESAYFPPSSSKIADDEKLGKKTSCYVDSLFTLRINQSITK